MASEVLLRPLIDKSSMMDTCYKAAGAERINYAIDKNCGGCRPVELIVFLYWLPGARCGKGYSKSSLIPCILRALRLDSTLPGVRSYQELSRRGYRERLPSDETLFLVHLSPSSDKFRKRDSSPRFSLDTISRTNRLIVSTRTRSSTKFVGDDTWLFANGRLLASKGRSLHLRLSVW